MAIKATLQPAIDVKGMPGFLLWARRDQPALYAALQRKFPIVARFEEAVQAEVPQAARIPGLGDFTDVLSSIGDSLSSAAGDIGSWVSNNAAGILSAGAGVAVAVKQAQVAQTQLQLAQLQRAPARTAVAYTSTGQPIAYPVQSNFGGGYSVMPTSGSMLGVPTWVWIAGGAGILALILLMPRR